MRSEANRGPSPRSPLSPPILWGRTFLLPTLPTFPADFKGGGRSYGAAAPRFPQSLSLNRPSDIAVGGWLRVVASSRPRGRLRVSSLATQTSGLHSFLQLGFLLDRPESQRLNVSRSFHFLRPCSCSLRRFRAPKRGGSRRQIAYDKLIRLSSCKLPTQWY